MAKKRPERKYYFRGLIERGPKYEHRNGYSYNIGSAVKYPWLTRAECRTEALRDGFKAVFED